METILVVEDDKLINDGITFYLKKDGYSVIQAFCIEEATKYISDKLDLIILDINFPISSGYELCRYVRRNNNTAVIFLTAKDSEASIIEGFEAGGDDYITKPFSLPVLKERIKAVIKRTSTNKCIYIYKNISFDMDKLTLTKDNKELSLTPTEIKLIQLFIQNAGKVLTREQLLGKVWDIDSDFVDENALNVNIRRLREKLEDNPSKPFFIKTVFGIGYVWGGNP